MTGSKVGETETDRQRQTDRAIERAIEERDARGERRESEEREIERERGEEERERRGRIRKVHSWDLNFIFLYDVFFSAIICLKFSLFIYINLTFKYCDYIL